VTYRKVCKLSINQPGSTCIKQNNHFMASIHNTYYIFINLLRNHKTIEIIGKCTASSTYWAISSWHYRLNLFEENINWILQASSIHIECTKYMSQNTFFIVPQLPQMMLHFMRIQYCLFTWRLLLILLLTTRRVICVFSWFLSKHVINGIIINSNQTTVQTRMWAYAQRDGHPWNTGGTLPSPADGQKLCKV